VGKHQPNRNVEVRFGQREDIPAVQTFLAEEGELSPVAIGVLAHADLVFWIAVEAGETVATILTRPLPFADGSMRGGADQLVVAAHRRNQGIGRRLMELAEGYYRSRGAIGMSLVVAADNAPAVHLYERLGYTPVQRRIRMAKDFL
jgi:ribosomal protein S18 acetylase RimI-like enzyme